MSEQENRDKIIDKVRKLLALSKSTNENEAKLALQQAMKLIGEFNVDSTELEKGSIGEYYYETGNKIFIAWKRNLFARIAHANFCHVLATKDFRKNQANYILVGRECNCIATRLMYEFILEAAKNQSLQFKNRKLKNLFLKGFAIGIGIKLQEERAHWGLEERSAIVLSEANEFELIKKFLKEKYDGKLKDVKETKLRNSKTLSSGIRAAMNTNLDRQINPEVKAIGG